MDPLACRHCNGTGRRAEGLRQVTCRFCNGWRVDFSTPTEAESYVWRMKHRAALNTSEG